MPQKFGEPDFEIPYFISFILIASFMLKCRAYGLAPLKLAKFKIGHISVQFFVSTSFAKITIFFVFVIIWIFYLVLAKNFTAKFQSFWNLTA